MLRRQQASAVKWPFRREIVDGAVGMVVFHLNNLAPRELLNLMMDKKATMVSDLWLSCVQKQILHL